MLGGVVLLLTALCLAACGAASPPIAQTMVALPTFAADMITIPATAIDSPTTEPDRVWRSQPFGANGTDKITISFYSQGGKGCIRYLLSTPKAQPIERCVNAGSTIAAVRGVEKDSTGNIYTIIAGRSFSSKIVVVSIELDHAENTPAEVSDSGFLVVLPDQRTVISVVPIDQYGNLVGPRYVFR